MRIAVLGRLQVLRGATEVDLGPHKQRALLAALALHAGEVVSLDRLADLVWGDSVPAAVTASLHSYVAGLRRLLEPDRSARSTAKLLLTEPPGYRLQLPEQGLDAAEFTCAAEAVHLLTPDEVVQLPVPYRPRDLEELLQRLETALALWRGTPYPELDGREGVDAERARLEELHWGAVQDRARLLLALGRSSAATADLASLASRDPLREDVTALLALALARSGRQADALQALRAHREALAEELGLDPGPAVRDLELAVLRQDPTVVPATRQDRPAVPDKPPTRASSDPAPAPASTHPAPVDGTGSAWSSGEPLLGRDRELEALEGMLQRAEVGMPQFAVLVGDAGIGKTRLVAELSANGQRRGFLVLAGRCSSDEGAPPLWPWVGVLRTLAEAQPEAGGPSPDRLLEPTGDGRADRFRLFDQVLAAITRAAQRVPVLLALDDLHWADASTLRLVQHLVEDLDQGRVALLVTRRPYPDPTGALADLGAAMARRHVLRLDIGGLTSAQVRALAAAQGGMEVDSDQAQRLRDRTGGNPFYLIELLRWRESAAGRDAAVGVPSAVGDVIAARVAQLPVETQQLLRTAAALNRHLDLAVLAALDAVPSDEVLDGLEPAMASGLVVVDPADGSLRFSHALVKEAVAATDSPLRRQRRHARLAQHLAGTGEPPERLSEIAYHWLRAGPAHAGQAWRTASNAAAYATGLTAHEEAADLLAAAVTSQRADPDPGWLDRYDLLMAWGRACRAAADSEGQRAATSEAMRLAADADDVERLALAAVTSSEGALWSNRPEGEIDPPTVDALHHAVRQLSGGDSELRCQVFLALSRELFWAPGRQEATAYAEQGLAMARRLDAPRLQAWGCHTLIVAAIRPATLGQRLQLAEESVRCARLAQDPELEAVGLFWQAVFAGESGRMTDRDEAVRGCRHIAVEHRLRYLQVMLGCYNAPWLALRGLFPEAQRELEATQRWAAQAAFPFRDEAMVAAEAWLALWQGRAGELLDRFLALDEVSPTDMNTALLLVLLRSGRLEEAAAHLERRPVPLIDDDFAVTLDLSIGAEAALLLRRPDLGAAVYALMSGWSGRTAAAGTGTPLGPVDAFLALAAAAVGETALASSHADEAARLCQEWGLEPVAAWFSALRERFGF